MNASVFMARIGKALLPALAALMLYWAENLKHPVMYALRAVELPLLCLAILAGLFLGGRKLRRNAASWSDVLSLALFASAWIALLAQTTVFYWQRAQVLKATPVMRTLGAHFVIGFRDFSELTELAGNGLIGGIYLTRKNIVGRSAGEIRVEIDRLQLLRAQAGLPPLLVAADQEGGRVNHLSPLLTALPALGELVNVPAASRRQAAYAYGKTQGAELAALGVNFNLSPVVDLKSAKIPGDWHTRTDQRAISSAPEIVESIAGGYCAGLQASRVGATLKHFPGLGRVRVDTHHAAASLDIPMATLRHEWAPFERISRESNVAIMLAHVHLPALDPGHPASQSRWLIQNVLRQQWGFQGLVMTDDLNMGAVYGGGIGKAAAASLGAGSDLVLVSYDHDQYYRALHGAARALERGELDERYLIEGERRLRRYFTRKQDVERS